MSTPDPVSPSLAPSNAAIAGAVAGAVTSIIVWAIGAFTHPTVVIPPDISAALTTVISFAFVYVFKGGKAAHTTGPSA